MWWKLCYWIGTWIVAGWARLCLWVTGWKLLTDQTYQQLEQVPRSVVIFSHSAYWDLLIFTLYGLAYPNRDHALKTLVTPWPFKYCGSILRRMGAIESTRVEDREGGAVERIIADLRGSEKFIFFISPKGTLRSTPWRRGYFAIAKKLRVPIFVAGLDYEHHSVVLHPPIEIAEMETESELQARLLLKIQTIVPLYPEGEVVPIRKHTRSSLWHPRIGTRLLGWPLRLIARSILWMMGWTAITSDQVAKLHHAPRSIAIFSHTSYVDFYILILELVAYPEEFEDIRTIIKPEPFEYAGWILRKLGAIPATRVDERNGGSVEKIAAQVEMESRFQLMLSPKGSIVKREWRNGYYGFSQRLQAPLLVVGLDYEKLCPYVSNSISETLPREEIEAYLKSQLSEIVPLFPEDEIVSIRPHQPPRIWDPSRLLILGSMVILGMVW